MQWLQEKYTVVKGSIDGKGRNMLSKGDSGYIWENAKGQGRIKLKLC